MSQVIEVKLWGVTVGRMGYVDDTGVALFEYDEAFLGSDVCISPIHMPTSQERFQFPDISEKTFHGLPGVFADSLPDTFGNQLIDLYMAEKGIASNEITALDRLLYIGNRGMGALEYSPSTKFGEETPTVALDIQMLSELAFMVASKSKEKSDKILHSKDAATAIKLLRIGSSAGGARSKALVSTSPNGEFLDGTCDHGTDHKYWLMKFDSEGNRDRDGFDPKGMTKVEYIYGEIAKNLGLDVPNFDYHEENGDFHFMIERFDRLKGENKMDKVQYASWSGLEHAHRDTTGAYSYEQLILLARKLKLPQTSIEELYRRAVFNVIGRNQDDHTKNFGFLMNKSGEWSLSKAFDLTYSYDPQGRWTRAHQIKLNGKQDDFTYDDLAKLGRHCNLSLPAIREIVARTADGFNAFDDLAKKLEVTPDLRATVVQNMRTSSIVVPQPQKTIKTVDAPSFKKGR